MGKIALRTAEQTKPSRTAAGIVGDVECRAYFDDPADPLHLHSLRLENGAGVSIDRVPADRLFYVWRGTVVAGGHVLQAGSSFIVENGGSLSVVGYAPSSTILAFSAHAEQHSGQGGHVHLLPRDRVSRVDSDSASGTSGGLHADGSCETCALWLNENSLPPSAVAPIPRVAAKGIHAHPEAEIIFVTEGDMRLGTKLFESGVAIAIAADTLYGFSAGPSGTTFITFRASSTTAIRFVGDDSYRDTDFWKAAGPLRYLAPVAAPGAATAYQESI